MDEVMIHGVFFVLVVIILLLCLQSHWPCDVFTFLPTVHFSTPGHGHRLLGSYCRVSFHVAVSQSHYLGLIVLKNVG